MENKLMTFVNEKFGKVRAVEINGEPWLVGRDIAEILGYSNPNEAIQDHVDIGDKHLRSEWGRDLLKLFNSVKDMQKNLGRQDNWFINESGVYSLIFSSKLPKAKEFKHWVTSEVLPSIRKNGMYMTDIVARQAIDNPMEFLARAVLIANDKIKELEATNKTMQPKADFYDAVANSESLLSMGDVAKTLDMGVGRNKLFKILRERGILMEDNVPYQRFVDAGYFKLIESHYMAGDNSVVSTTTYVKQKGIDYIRKILKEDIA